MFEIWGKEKIAKLSENEKQQWFDVLNYKLEKDRNISLDDPNLQMKQQEIRNDYFEYIESCSNADNFHKYYILKEGNKIISVCRVNIYDGKYMLEGLQTHLKYYRNGYAEKLLNFTINDLKKDDIKALYSEVRIWNDASNKLHNKFGFTKYKEKDNNWLYYFQIIK